MNENTEYAKWIWSDTSQHLLQAVAIYAVTLGAYWAFIG